MRICWLNNHALYNCLRFTILTADVIGAWPVRRGTWLAKMHIILLWLAYFTYSIVLWVHPHRHIWQDFLLFKGQILFHCMYIPHFLHLFIYSSMDCAQTHVVPIVRMHVVWFHFCGLAYSVARGWVPGTDHLAPILPQLLPTVVTLAKVSNFCNLQWQ